MKGNCICINHIGFGFGFVGVGWCWSRKCQWDWEHHVTDNWQHSVPTRPFLISSICTVDLSPSPQTVPHFALTSFLTRSFVRPTLLYLHMQTIFISPPLFFLNKKKWIFNVFAPFSIISIKTINPNKLNQLETAFLIWMWSLISFARNKEWQVLKHSSS